MEASASAAVCAAIAALGGQVDRDRSSYSCRSRSPPPRRHRHVATATPPRRSPPPTPPQTQPPIDTLLRNVSGHCSDVINNIKMMKMLDITDPDHVKARVGQCLHHRAIATKSLKQIITGIERLRAKHLLSRGFIRNQHGLYEVDSADSNDSGDDTLLACDAKSRPSSSSRSVWAEAPAI